MAVSRRQKENDTFNDIAGTLPIEESAKELDKASVLRIAIHYLKLRDVLADCEEETSPIDLSSERTTEHDDLHNLVPNFSKDVLQALDGFLMMVSKDGRVLYATDSISQYLGLRQVDVIGVHVQDIIHPQDYSEVATIFQSQGCDIGPEMEALCKDPLRRNFVVRMRCAFTPSVRSITRCSNFKPIYCSGFLKFSNKKVKEGEFVGMVMLCKLASVMKVKELCVGAFFKTKHSLDLSYTAVDTRIRWILGFDPAEMVGFKAYEYFHPGDLMATSSCHTQLLVKGRSHSPCYRFMARSGDWVWVRSKSCVTYDSITHLPNGLSIYTWIVRYDEEDERMKAITEGRDPGSTGVKDTAALLSDCNSSLDIKGLCVPNSSSSPIAVAANESKPQKPSNLVSPEVSPQPPPNINPFHSQSSPPAQASGSPFGTQTVSHDPFMGVINGSPNSTTISSPYSSSFGSCGRKSSLDQMSTRETTPPYSSYPSYSATPSGSPTSSLNRRSLSPTETVGYYNGSPTTIMSPPYSDPSYGSFPSLPPPPPPPHHQAPYQHYSPSSFTVDTTVYMSPPTGEYPLPINGRMDGQLYGMPAPMVDGFSLKQEPGLHAGVGLGSSCGSYAQYDSTGYMSGPYSMDPMSSFMPANGQFSTGSRIKETKSRYAKVGVAGGHYKMGAEIDATSAINNISEWLKH
ncbi:PREDICTED: single-minded homolog 2-like [Amphimedon queenslandica]|uniref:Uncharacterized protein n=1 Tax=Amphimedon queenslandica TaxID=400682 RepID=A0A1X7V3N7_AMPQE|nr:PREDICTED: single-minded homolog 2-like [Amphimedon queenslandica]|eukprot:XP_019850799.1 PREDICTED: single-minded homolog 2-like [Amphimedon queenslandica]